MPFSRHLNLIIGLFLNALNCGFLLLRDRSVEGSGREGFLVVAILAASDNFFDFLTVWTLQNYHPFNYTTSTLRNP